MKNPNILVFAAAMNACRQQPVAVTKLLEDLVLQGRCWLDVDGNGIMDDHGNTRSKLWLNCQTWGFDVVQRSLKCFPKQLVDLFDHFVR